MASQVQSNDIGGDSLVPLRKWIEGEGKKQISARQIAGFNEKRHKQEAILRKTTVAYGIAALQKHASDHGDNVDPSPSSLDEQCSIDNFAVRISGGESEGVAVENNLYGTCTDIKGVDMLSPPQSVSIVEPSFLCISDGSDDDRDDQIRGRYLEAEFSTSIGASDTDGAAAQECEKEALCRSLGVILYELYSNLALPSEEGVPGFKLPRKGESKESQSKDEDVSQEPEQKKARLADREEAISAAEVTSSLQGSGSSQENPEKAPQKLQYIPLTDLGLPSSICLLVENLLECGGDGCSDEAYNSLGEVIKDLHLLLLDPVRFLFDHEPTSEDGSMQLSFRENKLYGRETEVTLITDAFCRVSTGKSEAFFIGGFSGSGKSHLVNSLTARVDMAEGYVLSHKFDQMSKKRPLHEILSVFNNLCVVIREKCSQKDLLAIMKDLMDVFGNDFSALTRLLPHAEALSPQPGKSSKEKESSDQMNLRSVCFILQRFMRVVSSESHPVMLFLDDLQWCDQSSLTLVENILCDDVGSSCLFFVGSYRSNEVQEDHEIFRLLDSLRSSSVPTTTISLEGLNPEDLNTMISDALCMFPRICEPLSDMVFQKTKGNPFFVLAFLRSLIDGGLLEFCGERRRWVWDKDGIASMDITGNVLYLLSSKMSGLSDTIQSALKVAACFGIKMKESVVEFLSTTSEYSNLRCGLEQVIQEGFMIKVGSSEFKFVHDKVREAAYSLIPDRDKDQYHFNLGMALYKITKDKDVDDIAFSLADQINHGLDDSFTECDASWLELAELNEKAGVKAMKCSDYATARFYFNAAYSLLSLLPTDHWQSHYDFSLRLSFVFAKCAYSCGDVERAYEIVQTILSHAKSLSEKLDAYHLLVVILHDREAVEEAYTTTYEVLLQLGESIPDAFGQKETKDMVKATSKMLAGLSEESLLGMKEMDRKTQHLLQFYSSLTVVSFSAKPWMVPFFTCRMVQLSMEAGLCKYSMIGFVQYAGMCCSNNMVTDIQEACRIGKLAMAVHTKQHGEGGGQASILFSVYYGFVAAYSEHLQSCADNLRRGFEYGITSGDTSSSFLCSIHHIRTCLIAGHSLPDLLKRTEYYLDVLNRHGNTWAKTNILLYRDTITILMGVNDNDYSQVQENALQFPAETTQYHKAIRAYWIGHSERCHHFSEKLIQGSLQGGRHHRIFFMLYFGLNSFKIIRRTSSQKLKAVPRNALKDLKSAAEYSRWNFRNKVHLLEAETFSYEGRQEEAKASYAAAITSARCSRFIHEQGLACELAGHHYKKIGDHRSAWGFFNQAKQCYAEWGSQMKVDMINRQLESFQISLA